MKSKKVEPFLTNQSNRGTSTVSRADWPIYPSFDDSRVRTAEHSGEIGKGSSYR